MKIEKMMELREYLTKYIYIRRIERIEGQDLLINTRAWTVA